MIVGVIFEVSQQLRPVVCSLTQPAGCVQAIDFRFVLRDNGAMTPEEEKRKQIYDRRDQAILRAMAVVFFNGDEDAAWRSVFEVADRPVPPSPQKAPSAARMHLKATH